MKKFSSAVRSAKCFIAPQRGVTLIELMVALSISVLLIGGVLLLYVSGRAATVESNQLARAQENIRFVSDYLVRELRNAGFRDQASLRFEQFNSFAGIACGPPDEGNCGFATILDDGSLVIRLSGTTSCVEGFDSLNATGVIVRNRYFVDDGSLWCEGSRTGIDSETGDPVALPPRSVRLASGIDSVQFEFLCPPDEDECGVPFCALFPFGSTFTAEEDNLAQTCQGVEAQFQFATEGPNSVQFPINLTASFRNVALGRLKYAAMRDDAAEEEDEE